MTTRYRYRAANADGQIIEGQLQAASREGLLTELEKRHLYPIDLEEASPRASLFALQRVGRHTAVGYWARDLATLLAAGLPLDRALTVTSDQAGRPDLKAALEQVRTDVRGGARFADALRAHPRMFPPLLAAMIESGEASGALETVLAEAADHLENSAELRSQIRSALTYPALMGGVAAVGIAVLLVFVIPRFSAMLTELGGELPLSTRLIMGAGALFTDWWWLWVALGIAVAFGAFRLWTDGGLRQRLDERRLGWPWIGGFERKLATARFCRTLGLLLQSGLPIVPALEIASNAVGNGALVDRLARARAAVVEGDRLATALRGILPPLALQMIAVGEESGSLEEVCGRIATAYDNQVKRTLRTMVSFVEPALILAFGVIVGFVALAMLQAIYSLNAGF